MQLMTYDNDYDDYDDYDDNHDDHDDDHVDDDAGSTYLQAVDRCAPLFPNSLFHITIMVALSSYIAPNNICPSYTSIAFFQSKHCCGGGKGSTLQLAAWRLWRKVLLPINLDQKICKLSAEILLLGKLLTCSSDAEVFLSFFLSTF